MLLVATNQKTRQGLKQGVDQSTGVTKLYVATNQKTRQGLKPDLPARMAPSAMSCNEPENPTGIETRIGSSSDPGKDQLQRTRKPDRD